MHGAYLRQSATHQNYFSRSSLVCHVTAAGALRNLSLGMPNFKYGCNSLLRRFGLPGGLSGEITRNCSLRSVRNETCHGETMEGPSPKIKSLSGAWCGRAHCGAVTVWSVGSHAAHRWVSLATRCHSNLVGFNPQNPILVSHLFFEIVGMILQHIDTCPASTLVILGRIYKLATSGSRRYAFRARRTST